MASSIRGAGLFMADSALAALIEDPERLDLARGRFSESPPSYRSHMSHNSTVLQSPDPPSEEQQHREEWKWQLIQEHEASFPSNQFRTQKLEELEWMREAAENRTRRRPVGPNWYELAEEAVKSRWVEQGIWNDDWKNRTVWRWKHEEPLEPESELEANADADVEAPLSASRQREQRQSQGDRRVPRTRD
jgi:hypothetical protein